jgi:hypothetical protein
MYSGKQALFSLTQQVLGNRAGDLPVPTSGSAQILYVSLLFQVSGVYSPRLHFLLHRPPPLPTLTFLESSAHGSLIMALKQQRQQGAEGWIQNKSCSITC